MKKGTTKALAIRRFDELMSIIENEYMLAKYLYENVATEASIFKGDEQKQHDYSVYARGRLAVVTELMAKANKVSLDTFSYEMKGP